MTIRNCDQLRLGAPLAVKRAPRRAPEERSWRHSAPRVPRSRRPRRATRCYPCEYVDLAIPHSTWRGYTQVLADELGSRGVFSA